MADNPGQFKPGSNGNPGGRRGNPELFAAFRARCRELEPAALEALKTKLAEADLKAAEMVLHYAWGKPPAVVAGEGGEGPAVIEIVRRIVDARTSDAAED